MFKRQQQHGENNISLQDFHDYFQALVSDAITQDDIEIHEFLNLYDNNYTDSTYQELDEPITQTEIKNAIKRLKTNKSCSTDCLLNEYFIESIDILIEPIQMIFNHILDSKVFPSMWAEGIIVPIFKKVDKNEPSNYRGITLISCFGKLFTRNK